MSPPASRTRPLVGIAASSGEQYGQPANVVLSQYIEAVERAADAIAVLIPARGKASDIDGLLERLDGLCVPGDRSNVAPGIYGGREPPTGEILDHDRDATTLTLIPAALERGVPLLAICRGFQELNVALGGTLHARVHEISGYADHRAPTTLPAETRFAPTHEVTLEAGGLLAAANGGTTQATVNSLHAQGIDRLAPGLAVEARAPDGLVEAARVPDSRTFALGVQWHPEWRATQTPFYGAIFAAFAAALRGEDESIS